MTKNDSKKEITMSDILKATENLEKLSSDLKNTISPKDPSAMLKTLSIQKRTDQISHVISGQAQDKTKLKNKCRSLKQILTTTKKNAYLAVVLASAISAFGGYQVANYNIERANQNQEFVVENTNYKNPYDYSELYSKTNNFLKEGLREALIEARPDSADTIREARIDTFRENSEVNSFDVDITTDYNVINSRHTYTYVVQMDDKWMAVYDAFRDMRILSNSVPEEEQNSVDYMLDVNNATTNLIDALKDYKNKDNKDLEKDAQDVIKDSRSYSDDDGER